MNRLEGEGTSSMLSALPGPASHAFRSASQCFSPVDTDASISVSKSTCVGSSWSSRIDLDRLIFVVDEGDLCLRGRMYHDGGERGNETGREGRREVIVKEARFS